ncbi:hypothetical protein SAMN05216389_102184 [Oceanobacillus limi]|uniref:Uncharacterized protein n=1 Tax=Oceanobacillus limi TaxID=930131 RepID=A0A1H9ZBH8_9BACI|nr:hypothetical protein [Oceanobacillus limi]SES78974.1 hypothetical protein SAMN05216389_102184 [Oceanobacillus limi]
MLNQIRKFLSKGNEIRFELDTWHKWYKEPKKFHEEVVSHLEKEGKKVQTIFIVKNITSNKVSDLLIDDVHYELTVETITFLGPAQRVVLKGILN